VRLLGWWTAGRFSLPILGKGSVCSLDRARVWDRRKTLSRVTGPLGQKAKPEKTTINPRASSVFPVFIYYYFSPRFGCAVSCHGQHSRLLFFPIRLPLLGFFDAELRATHDIGQRGVFQNLGRPALAYIEKHLIQRALAGIPAIRLRSCSASPKGRERAVNQAKSHPLSRTSEGKAGGAGIRPLRHARFPRCGRSSTRAESVPETFPVVLLHRRCPRDADGGRVSIGADQIMRACSA